VTKLALPIETRPAKRSATMLAGYGVDRVMVSFSTLSRALPDRVHNIRLGASTINGYLLAPGELFSFSESSAKLPGKRLTAKRR